MLAQVVIVADHFMGEIEETGGVTSVNSRKHMVDLGLQRLSHYKPSAALVLFWIPAVVFWPRFFGLATLDIGLPAAIRSEAAILSALSCAALLPAGALAKEEHPDG
jgi:hypothetical protein